MAEVIIALEYLHCLGMALVLSITLLSAVIEFYEPSQQCRILMHSGTECGVIFAKLIFTQHHVDMIESGDWLCKLLVWLGQFLYGYGGIEKPIFYGNVIQIC
jgi:hypothetical protein